MKIQCPILAKNTSANERVYPILSLVFEFLTQTRLRLGSEVRENLREYFEAVGNLWSSSEAVGKSSVIIGRYRKIFGNSRYVKTKISRIGLKKSWHASINSSSWLMNKFSSVNTSALTPSPLNACMQLMQLSIKQLLMLAFRACPVFWESPILAKLNI